MCPQSFENGPIESDESIVGKRQRVRLLRQEEHCRWERPVLGRRDLLSFATGERKAEWVDLVAKVTENLATSAFYRKFMQQSHLLKTRCVNRVMKVVCRERISKHEILIIYQRLPDGRGSVKKFLWTEKNTDVGLILPFIKPHSPTPLCSPRCGEEFSGENGKSGRQRMGFWFQPRSR